MRILRIGVFGAALVFLASCGTIGSDRQLDYGAKARQLPNLEVPPDLTVPGSDDQYKVPQEGVAATTYSDYSKGGSAKSRGSNGAVLPEVPQVHLERNGSQRWLVVKESPERVWAVTRAFLLELGLTIRSEDKAAGVMETDWAENRAKIPQSLIRSVIGKVFDKLYSSGERDQYLVRLERGKDAATEVYITHRGMMETFSGDMTVSGWQMRPSEPELEAIMLQRLMTRFGVSETQAASAVAEAATAAAASAVPAVSVSEPAGTATLREGAGGSVVIVINDPFDRSWRKVGLAIESAGLAVEDRNRETGTYFLRPIKIEKSWLDALKFWKSDEDTEHQYRVNVKDGGASCEVSVTDQNGATSTAARQMTEAIYKYINQ